MGFLVGMAQGHTQNLEQQLDDYVRTISERHRIPGAALAIVKDGQVVHQKYYGKANIEHGVPMKATSLFRIYSLTKLMISTGIFQLFEQQKLSLDDPISRHVSGIPESWGVIQVKHLLTHSCGLPDMAPFTVFEGLTEEEAKTKVFHQPVKFNAGDQYDYNQTAFWLLQRIIENVSGKRIEDFIRDGQFTKESWGRNVLFSSDSRDIITHRVTPYFYFRTGKLIADLSFVQGRYLLSANGLNITLDEFIKWDQGLRKNRFVKRETKKHMWERFPYTKTDSKKFTYGWDEHVVNGQVSYGFSGSLVTAYRTYPDTDMSIIFLTNGLGNYYNIENIVNYMAGLVDGRLIDLNNVVYEKLLNQALTRPFTKFPSFYRLLKAQGKFRDIDFEGTLNSVGYMLLNVKRKKRALEVFNFNVKEYPKSWNVWDSLAEGYESLGDVSNAIKFYRKSVEINPANEHGLQRIAALTQ